MATIGLPISGAFSSLVPGSTLDIANLSFELATTTPSEYDFGSNVPSWVTLSNGIDLSLAELSIDTTVPVCLGTSADNTAGTTCRSNVLSPFKVTQLPQGVALNITVQGNVFDAGVRFAGVRNNRLKKEHRPEITA
jgi:hypothetical protein